jgi:hypothetical protein
MFSPVDLIRAECMLELYSARWSEEPLRTLAVEVEYRAPLINPATGAASRTFQRAGKIDVIVEDAEGRVWTVEHKTSSEDISPGSDYFARLAIDGQVSHYAAGARALGFDPAGCIYDVLGKPRHEPHAATPVELRRYTQEKRDKAGNITEPSRLYASQRADDEDLEAFRTRLRAALLADPDSFVRRAQVVRLEADMADAAFDDWQTARAIREAELADRWPRSPEACTRYGSRCSFWGVCTRTATLDELPLRAPHEELSQAGRSLPLLTPSSSKTFRACARQYRHRYLDGRGGRQSAAASFGTLIHAGLEAWGREVGDDRLPAAIAAMRHHVTETQREAA